MKYWDGRWESLSLLHWEDNKYNKNQGFSSFCSCSTLPIEGAKACCHSESVCVCVLWVCLCLHTKACCHPRKGRKGAPDIKWHVLTPQYKRETTNVDRTKPPLCIHTFYACAFSSSVTSSSVTAQESHPYSLCACPVLFHVRALSSSVTSSSITTQESHRTQF